MACWWGRRGTSSGAAGSHGTRSELGNRSRSYKCDSYVTNARLYPNAQLKYLRHRGGAIVIKTGRGTGDSDFESVLGVDGKRVPKRDPAGRTERQLFADPFVQRSGDRLGLRSNLSGGSEDV